MRKYLKRLILFTMVLSLLIQTTQIPAMASTVGDSQNHSLESETTNYEMVATNDFGAMLKNSIQEEQETDSDYNLFDIVVTGNIATVTYCAADNSIIVAAIYDESGKMLASGKGTADADEESVDITIDIDTMPEYFLVSAYMLDEQSNNPRCESFTSQYYTEAFQDFLSKTVYDFDEDKVLNLDDDVTTNFAVYHDTTTLIRPTSGANTIVSIDEENRIYTIGNIDESIKSLKTGDIFVYSYDEENTIIVKIADINIEDTTATIVGQEVSLEEVFSYVKIDAESDASNFDIDNSDLEDGLTYVGSGEVEPLLRAIDIEGKKTIKLKYNFKDYDKTDIAKTKASIAIFN